ncbi:MAG: ABC transporter permease, partial [Bacteroidota bacterium]
MTFYLLFKSYFKLALRHSWKNKWSVLINVLGLGVALSMCIFVYSLYAHNIEFDSFYENTDDVYRINSMTFENGKERRNELTPIAMDRVLRNEIGSVLQVSSFFDEYFNVKYKNEFFEESVGVASKDFFNMFSIPLWYGAYEGFADQPLVYLTKPTAKKYFGDEVALGEKLTFYLSATRKIELEVGGVFERIPLNSSFSMDMLISLDSYIQNSELNPNDWDNRLYLSHYIRTTEKSISTISDQMAEYIPLQNEGHKELKMNRFELVPFKSDIHNNANMYRNNTNIRLDADIYIIFTSLAGMVFLIACFNLANTSIAMIAKRLKEIGIRKTLGSENRQILMQFLMEMGVICLLAFIVGL